MEQELNLAELSRNISDKLLDSTYLLAILEEIENDAKPQILLSIIKNNITSAFFEIEQCRKKIGIIE